MVEAGFTRAKNSINILMKNMLDFCMGALAFWAIGFGLMFGINKTGFFVTSEFFLAGLNGGADPWGLAFWMFQVVFAATDATIVSGAMAERTKFTAYLFYSAIIAAFIYLVLEAGHGAVSIKALAVWGDSALSILQVYGCPLHREVGCLG